MATERRFSGNDHLWVANSLMSLGRVLEEQGKLADAETAIREALAIRRELLEAHDLALASALAGLANLLLVREKSAEAEPLARECLALRETKMPYDWLTFNARSLLGGSLLGQKRYGEAEPWLLSDYEGIKQRRDRLPANGKTRLKQAIERLVQLYEATGRPDKATLLQAELNR